MIDPSVLGLSRLWFFLFVWVFFGQKTKQKFELVGGFFVFFFFYYLMQCSEPCFIYLPQKTSFSAVLQPSIMLAAFFKLDEKVALFEVQAYGPESAYYSVSVSSVYSPSLKWLSLETSGIYKYISHKCKLFKFCGSFSL